MADNVVYTNNMPQHKRRQQRGRKQPPLPETPVEMANFKKRQLTDLHIYDEHLPAEKDSYLIPSDNTSSLGQHGPKVEDHHEGTYTWIKCLRWCGWNDCRWGGVCVMGVSDVLTKVNFRRVICW